MRVTEADWKGYMVTRVFPRLLSAPLLKVNFWWFNTKQNHWHKVKEQNAPLTS